MSMADSELCKLNCTMCSAYVLQNGMALPLQAPEKNNAFKADTNRKFKVDLNTVRCSVLWAHSLLCSDFIFSSHFSLLIRRHRRLQRIDCCACTRVRVWVRLSKRIHMWVCTSYFSIVSDTMDLLWQSQYSPMDLSQEAINLPSSEHPTPWQKLFSCFWFFSPFLFFFVYFVFSLRNLIKIPADPFGCGNRVKAISAIYRVQWKQCLWSHFSLINPIQYTPDAV